MLIEETKLRHWIEHFYGYGSWKARVWFVAHEEGGGDLPEEVAEKIEYFHSHHPEQLPALCDIRELYSHVAVRFEGPKAGVFANFNEFRFGPNAVVNGVWKNLITFLHGYRHEEPLNPLEYQRTSFASPLLESEALIKLYPLPAPHNHGWYYSWLDMPQLPFLKSRALYQNHVYERRVGTLLENIIRHRPQLVLMYGMENINALKHSVQQFFDRVNFRMVKAVPRQIPQHHRADLNGTTLLITTQIPALRHNRIETGFEWGKFGEVARGRG